MTRYYRIGALLISIVLLLLVVPDTFGWQLPGSEHIKILAPAFAIPSRVRPPFNINDFLITDVPPASGVVEATPTAAPTASERSSEPPLALQAENHLLEMREVRRALLARTPVSRADATPTGTPVIVAAAQPATATAASRTAVPAPVLTFTVTPTPWPVNFEVFIHLPPDAAQHQPLRVLLILHGMGGRGDKFAQGFLAQADRNNWVVVAPNLPYTHDYLDPAQLMEEDLSLARSLHSLLEGLPQRLGLKLRTHALVLGFSRGAQLGHRLALFFPEHIESVAVISAGSYTMPMANETGSGTKVMVFPYGVGDLLKLLGASEDWTQLKKLSFWVAVGEKDNRPNEVSRAFDPYQGKNRVERARAFFKALQDIGVDAHLVIFPNTDHEVTSEMRAAALDFLRQDELADHWND